MQIAIIADDLTGANDSGVQFAKRGFHTTVMMGTGDGVLDSQEVIVFDTDTRGKSPEDAYRLVRETAEWVKRQGSPIIFKKIDSTMRGNIGAELNAVYDVYQPEFLVIAPAFPQLKRQVIDGFHYVEGRLLHETEFAQDPISPVKVSYLPELLQGQTKMPIGLITKRELADEPDVLLAKLREFKEAGIPYLLFDSAEEDDLKKIVDIIEMSKATVVWVGSAGLAGHLLCEGKGKATPAASITLSHPVLMVVGSVSRKARTQLKEVLASPNVVGVGMISSLVAVSVTDRADEMERVFRISSDALRDGNHVVLYSTGDPEDVAQIDRLRLDLELTGAELGARIASALGEVSSKLVQSLGLGGIVLTGGDTAKHFCEHSRIREFILVDEVETGIPIGYLTKGEKFLFAVTKAGGFGTNEALVKALHYLQRGESA